MFGYVTINKLELKVKDYYKYRAYYCGLCRTLKEQHGRKGQVTLTYDMTFLIILLSSLYEPKFNAAKERCLTHPVKQHPMIWNEITEYAADMNIALTYHHLLDDWNDERKVSGYAGSKLYQNQYKKIEKKYPRQCEKMEEMLSKLVECEKANETNVDEVARNFGELMAELFVYRQDEWEEELRKIGFFLGKFIYIIDAYDDIEKDIKGHCYNPLKSIYGQDDYEKRCEQMLLMMISECTNAFERLPLEQDMDILRNILYDGVWVKFDHLHKEKEKGKVE